MTRGRNRNGLEYWAKNQGKDLSTESKGKLGDRAWATSWWLVHKFYKTYFLEIQYDRYEDKTVFIHSVIFEDLLYVRHCARC